ncbi:ATP-binding cassette domain-containing protein, partial [uncultured Actinomyces sp.]|uniref:ATP-binding cassette domain-containing protein n=1 Tax=uncultured Actinomyces sp. TaxID=249061 RepID=UPI00260FA3E1
FGMVLQDTWTFQGTLRENLVYDVEGVDDERLDEICAATGITELVRQLPQGYDTLLDETVTLSAGQKQLMTIARAMVKDAPLLILDEATSSVDTRTEIQVQAAMDRLMQGRTSFVIAHRLSTIRNADLILYLEGGDVKESGTHAELLERGGAYAALYNSQFDPA